MSDLDTEALKNNFEAVAAHGGDTVAMFFYSYLFVQHPETRDLFPPAMTRQRDRLVGAVGHIVANVDKVDDLVRYLEDLGRDHRKFGALSAHYPAVGEALVATLNHFSGDAWNDKLASDWAAAYGIVAEAMAAAADADADWKGAFWDAEILHVDQRTFDISVLTVRTDEPVPYLAGQSLAVEATDLRPREWRWFSPTTRPGSRTFQLHVRVIDGGPVSTALALAARAGTRVRLGPPIGRMTLDPESDRPLLLIAGSTGLAPLRALIDQVAADGGRPTHLFFGARTVRENYDAEALARLDEEHSWLSIVTAISDDSQWPGEKGLVGEVALSHGDWSGHDVFVCGSPAMVEATVKLYVANGIPEARIKFDEFGQR
jgi:NAD(P)H-flavin reductase/hemoglobin-like flavoprotein